MGAIIQMSAELSMWMSSAGELITGADYKQLEFSGTRDTESHAKERSKTLMHDQIVLMHDAVVIAPNQPGTNLRHNLCQTKGFPESYKHMAPSMIRSIRRRVKTARDQLTISNWILRLFLNR